MIVAQQFTAGIGAEENVLSPRSGRLISEPSPPEILSRQWIQSSAQRTPIWRSDFDPSDESLG